MTVTLDSLSKAPRLPLPVSDTRTVVKIGDLRYPISSAVPLDARGLPAGYREFRLSRTVASECTTSDRDAVQPVEVIAELPELEVGLKTMSHAGPWSMLAWEDKRVMVWHGLESSRPLWYARFSICAGTPVEIYCGTELVREENGQRSIRDPFTYPLDQVLVVYALARVGGVLLHAAGLCGGGRGLICPGRSRAGKSTVSRLWLQHGGACLSDDRIIVRSRAGEGGEWTAFGTPWPGELGIARQASVEAGGLVFLQNAGDNRTTRLSPQATFEKLLPVASLLWYDPDMLQKGLSACEALSAKLPGYAFGFTRDEQAVKSLHELCR